MAGKLTQVLLDPVCNFKGKTGTQVTLKLVGTKGNVEFIEAKYGGVEVPGLPADSLTLTLLDGVQALDVVYTFSMGQAGRGELHEDGDDEPLLDSFVRGDNPVTRYVILSEGVI